MLNIFKSMTFTSLGFYPFLFIIIMCLFLVKTEVYRQYFIIFASSIFYISWDLRCFLLLLAEIIFCYFISAKIYSANKNKTGAKKYIVVGIVFLLIILGIFKYYNFFIEPLLSLLNIKNGFTLKLFLPIGISFYTFSALSLLLDVYWQNITEKVQFRSVAFYILYFPKLLQGPIHNAQDFIEQLGREHPITLLNLQMGIQIFLFGLIKKIVIADRLGLFVDTVYKMPQAYDAATLLLAVLSYLIQLYLDFSGYSDMAVGVSKMMGYDLCRNFNMPFMSKNVAEYWRRWHMSLNIWFRNYLFYPILKSGFAASMRKKLKKMGYLKLSKITPPVIGMMIVWPLVGLWHGASLSYVLYGLIYGILMAVGFIYQEYYGIKLEDNLIINILRILRTMIITVILSILFKTESVSGSLLIIHRIFNSAAGINHMYAWSLIYLPVVMLINIYAYLKNHGEGYYIILDLSKFINKLIFCIIFLMTIILMYNGENYFMYFQY